MSEYSIREIQLAQLEIAKELKRVCEENGIKYFMDSGTLLGAVRHEGFIPWDDDMDFAMLRDDYEKLVRIAPHAFKEGFLFQTWDNDPYYPFRFAKLRRLGTKFVETSLKKNKAHNELYVDIFPYDSYPEKKSERIKQGRKIERYRFAYMMKLHVKPWLNHKMGIERLLVFIKYVPSRIYACVKNQNRIKELLKREMVKYNGRNTRELFAQGGSAPYGKWIMNREYFSELVNLKFEDTSFPAPKLYDEYLKRAYGDYMKLPPEDKRGDKHKVIEVAL